MKIESYALSNNEVLSAVEMFVEEREEKYGRYLNAIGCKTEIVDYHAYAGDLNLTPDWMLKQEEDFFCKFGKKWKVYVLYTPTEMCGLIAFADWD